MNKPRLLIAADTYFPKKDGVVRFLKETVDRLSANFNVTLIVPNFEKRKIEVKKGKTTIIKLPTSRFVNITGYSAVKFSFKSRRLIKQSIQETDYVFVQDLAPIGSWAIKYAQQFKKPLLAYIHQINWEQVPSLLPKIIRPFVRSFIKKFSIRKYNRCDYILVPYETLGQELAAAGIQTKREVISLGIDTETFKPSENKVESKLNLRLNPSHKIIGYVGRISDEKNLDTLLETFNQLQGQYPIYLLIVGGGPKQKIRRFENNKNTKVTGFVSRVVPYLQAMDIFVMPSLTETTSLATLEAMACGVPVITTKVGFLQEYVIKNFNGLLFPKGNSYNLKIQLKKLLENPKLRKILGKNAREIAQTFSWDNTASGITAIIKKI